MINASLASMTTNLPMPQVGQSVQYVPQYNAVSWAFAQGRKALRGEPITATLVLVAYAQHAEAAMHTGDGYLYTDRAAVRNLTGLSDSTIRTHTKTLVRKGLLNDRSYLSGVRLPEEAFNAEWVQR